MRVRTEVVKREKQIGHTANLQSPFYIIGAVEACSQTLVCQSSDASVSGSQGGSATRRYSASALTYGSYLARSAVNFWSASEPSRSVMPASASIKRSRVRSVGGRRFRLGMWGGVS